MYMGIYGPSMFSIKNHQVKPYASNHAMTITSDSSICTLFIVDRPIVHRRTIDIAIKDKSTIGVQYRLTDRTMTVSSNQPLPFDLEGAHQGDGRKLTFEKLLVISNSDLDNPPL